MKFERLEIVRAPRLPRGLHLELDDAPLALVVGANGSGKSSLARAATALLFDAERFEGDAAATLASAGGPLRAERDAGRPAVRQGRWPALPDPSVRDCFRLSLEAFADGGSRDAVAARLRRELDAGFDLSGVLRDERAAEPGGYHARRAAQERAAAAKQRRAVEAAHGEVLAAERELARLEAERAAAQRALAERGDVEAALELARRRVELPGLEAALQELPEELAHCRPEDADDAERLDAELAAAEDAYRAVRDQVARARAELDALGLPDGGVDQALLGLLDDREQDTDRAQQRVIAATEAVRRAREALVALGLDPDAEPEASVGDARAVEALEQAHAALLAARHEHEAQRRALALLDPPEPAAGRRGERLERGAHALEAWLAAEAPRRGIAPTALALSALGLAAAVAASVPDLVPEDLRPAVAPVLAALFALLAALAVARLLQRSAVRDRAQRRAAYESLELDAPDAWEPFAVARRLGDLARERAEHDRRLRAADARADRERDADRAAEREREAEARVAESLGAFGLDAPAAPFESLAAARRLLDGGAARAGLAAAEGELAGARARAATRREARERAFAALGLALPADAEEAERESRRVAARERRRRDLAAALEDQAADEQRRNGDLARRRKVRAEFYNRRGVEPGDRAHLAERLALLEEWRARRDALRDARRSVETLTAKLGDRARLAGKPVSELEARLAASDADHLSERLGETSRRIADAEQEVRRVREGRALEDALATERAAEEGLAEQRERCLDAAAADALLAEVEAEWSESASADLLGRARERFAAFTRGRYKLARALAGEEHAGLGLVAVAEDGARQPLDRLSSGTRAQLHLALRLALATLVETEGDPLPLFLDEALSNSDPRRFEAVGEALVELAAEGRQVVFLTSDPVDADRLERLAAQQAVATSRHDLDPLRRERAAATADELGVVARTHTPPPSEGEAAEAYARRLAVPPIDAWSDADGLHLYHLLSDDLPALHGLLANRVETLGQLRAASEHAWLADGPARTAERVVAGRAPAARAFLEAWRVGRARPATPGELRDALGGSKMTDDVLALAETVGRDGEALLDALTTKETAVPGFGPSRIESLRAELAALDLLDDAEPLDGPTLAAEVARACAAPLREGRLEPAELRDLVDAWERSLAGVDRLQPR